MNKDTRAIFPNESESKESIDYTVDYTIQKASLTRINAIVEEKNPEGE